MWKSRKEDEKPYTPPAPPQPTVTPAAPAREFRPVETPKMDQFRAGTAQAGSAYIGKSVVIKGELSGGEDLYIDGEVEGSIELRANSLTIGPSGRIRANIQARDVVIQGRVEGNVRGSDRVQLKSSAILNGDIFTQRIAIEDGALLKGGIDIQKLETKAEARRELSTAASIGKAAPGTAGPQGSLLENK